MVDIRNRKRYSLDGGIRGIGENQPWSRGLPAALLGDWGVLGRLGIGRLANGEWS